MPPPNANGELHIGHTYGYAVMDILGRYHRMKGFRTLLVPGKDHAGIQTQVVFEKKLKAEKVDTSKMSTKDLYDRCYDFCIDRAQYMRAQEKSIGLSADFSKELFTLDPRLNKVVFETFIKMWNDGLIYRGHRIVNWSVFSQTAISDVEVEYAERDGHLWYIRYDLADGPTPGEKLKLPSGQEVTIGAPGLVTATTRPETMLGDTALAVHPDDTRYQRYIGKEVIVPLVNRRIEVIADKRIDPTFGTGVVKVTPAHDFTDYDIGVTHNLEQIQVIGKDGLMTAAAGADFVGQPSATARELVVSKLSEQGRLLDTIAMRHKVPIGERGKDVIEPLISEQWFVAVDKPGNSLRQKALDLVSSGKIAIHPERFKVLFEQWLENLRDWNISRQLWWGHRLPVWYKGSETYVGLEAPKGEGWEQETDVFDTWFSSGQWAYSTAAGLDLLDIERGTSDFFPTHTMVMGRDILLFWACRMLLMTAYRMNNIPWKNIYFTGLIRDEHGQKMSKSKGNGVEPKDIIGKYGVDALRMAMILGATPGNDIAFAERKVDGYSKFVNKLWNAAKLIELKLSGAIPTAPTAYKLATTRWLSGELNRIHQHVSKCMDSYELSIAAGELYEFAWGTYCDWYLEFFKVSVEHGNAEEKNEALYHAVESFGTLLAMLHPFMPFVTEELYQALPGVKRAAVLAAERWESRIKAVGEQSTVDLERIRSAQEIITSVRSVKAALNLASKTMRIAVPDALNSEMKQLITGVGRVEIVASSSIESAKALRKSVAAGTIVLELEDKLAYKSKLEKDLGSARNLITSLKSKLAGDFGKAAKPELIEQERQRLSATEAAAQQLESELQSL
jgi:valyl-tRNA synthetase